MARRVLLVAIVVSVTGAGCGGKTAPAVVTPHGAKQGEPFVGSAMEGPFPDVAAICAMAAEIKETDDFWIEARQTEVETYCAPAEVKMTAMSTPYRGATVISAGWGSGEGTTHEQLFLAIQTEAGWFTTQVGDLQRDGGTHDRDMLIAARLVEQRDIGSPLPVIVTEVRWSNEGCNWVDGCVDDEELTTTICGVGPTGRLSCQSPLWLSEITNWAPDPSPWLADGAGAPPEAERHQRRIATLTYPGGGAIELAGELDHLERRVAGRHLLDFP